MTVQKTMNTGGTGATHPLKPSEQIQRVKQDALAMLDADAMGGAMLGETRHQLADLLDSIGLDGEDAPIAPAAAGAPQPQAAPVRPAQAAPTKPSVAKPGPVTAQPSLPSPVQAPPAAEAAEVVVAKKNMRVNQGEYAHVTIGNTDETAKKVGCVTASLTMASAYLTPHDYDLVKMNTLITEADAYNSKAQMNVAVGAAAGGMIATRVEGPQGMRELERNLSASSPVRRAGLLHVQYKKWEWVEKQKSMQWVTHNHYVFAHRYVPGAGDGPGTLYGINPSGGRDIAFTPTAKGYIAGEYKVVKAYELEAAPDLTPATVALKV